MRAADQTFRTKTEAEQWLTRTETDILDDEWTDPDAGLIPFAEYASTWIDERPDLRPKTVQLYRYLLRRHLATTPAFGAIMNTAVEDGLIRRNPCRIKGAGQEKSAERPVLTIGQVFTLAETITPRYRALILLAVFASLRWGELAALRRPDIDLDICTVMIERTLTELSGGGYAFGQPKSDAGRRVVSFPDLIAPDLTWHLARFTGASDDALIFTSPTGAPLRHGNFRRRVWLPALTAASLPAIHFHDLRHTGNHLTAEAGATLRELMDRMGHSSTRAALTYLHTTSERQRTVADAVGTMTRAALSKAGKRPDGSASGTDLARARKKAR